jgi:hypothetical protein
MGARVHGVDEHGLAQVVNSPGYVPALLAALRGEWQASCTWIHTGPLTLSPGVRGYHTQC